ncbi:hypothetical protein BKA66DRAFT_597520 [Pyrenochaeta sp. MPI-SDFR-AT-0127]|nr:hypothetical protein BKA66DRAFT_597520 [Pyrenochaeta sp. MPI-SDFR-AT-0127]
MKASLMQLGLVGAAFGARILPTQANIIAAGSGPYSASYYTEPVLTNHTIFAPASPPSNLKLPIFIWGQTGCSYNALRFQAFLTEIASHGILVIANGTPNGKDNPNGIGETNSPSGALHKAALDWIGKEAGVKGGKYENVIKERVAVAGQSCGGMQAFQLFDDARVTTIGIFNSGEVAVTGKPAKVTKPIFYFLGGSTDIAYTNKKGERDYSLLPTTTPRWKGNLALGHMGDYDKTNGGKFGVAAVAWVKYLLRGDSTAAAFFTGTGAGTAKGGGWETVGGALDGIKVTPLKA